MATPIFMVAPELGTVNQQQILFTGKLELFWWDLAKIHSVATQTGDKDSLVFVLAFFWSEGSKIFMLL